MPFGYLEPVVLNVDLPKSGLPKRSLGTVVHIYGEEAFEVEFLSANGRTVSVITLKPTQLRHATDQDLVCVWTMRSRAGSPIVREPARYYRGRDTDRGKGRRRRRRGTQS